MLCSILTFNRILFDISPKLVSPRGSFSVCNHVPNDDTAPVTDIVTNLLTDASQLAEIDLRDNLYEVHVKRDRFQ